ncbi:hypothetical protein DB31_4575 [Hyalangium minutum]|uniref:Uncharacterized protein n=1 Tax=Hyalangium minutum TaxID=394096 RepID=A0A085VZT8_9BACT|nr:hypothetical protein DB31_4575 [Hyalangium minutum]
MHPPKMTAVFRPSEGKSAPLSIGQVADQAIFRGRQEDHLPV